jgi:hypothetical protein
MSQPIVIPCYEDKQEFRSISDFQEHFQPSLISELQQMKNVEPAIPASALTFITTDRKFAFTNVDYRGVQDITGVDNYNFYNSGVEATRFYESFSHTYDS